MNTWMPMEVMNDHICAERRAKSRRGAIPGFTAGGTAG